MTRTLVLTAAPLALAALLTSTAWAEDPQITPLSPDEITEMQDGERLRELERGDPVRGQVIGLIEAPADQLASIISDYDHVLEWAPALRAFEVVERDGEAYVIEGETVLPWPLANRTWRMRSQFGWEDLHGQNAFVYQWQYIPGSGNIDDSFGYWLVTDLAGHPGWSYVKYVVNADPGMALPDFVVNWATRSALPDVINGLEERHDEVY